MKTLYIAGPFRGPTAWDVRCNVHRAEQKAAELIGIAAEFGQAVAVLVPHSLGANFNGTMTNEYWLEATMEWLRRCDAVFMLDGWSRSQGATAERAEAMRLGKPVFFNPDDVVLWLKGAKP